VLETFIIVATSVALSLLTAWLSKRTGLGARLRKKAERAAVDATFGMPEAPESDAVVLVEVKRVPGCEDPELVNELRELSRKLHVEASKHDASTSDSTKSEKR
jgi:hypothetical protein